MLESLNSVIKLSLFCCKERFALNLFSREREIRFFLYIKITGIVTRHVDFGDAPRGSLTRGVEIWKNERATWISEKVWRVKIHLARSLHWTLPS